MSSVLVWGFSPSKFRNPRKFALSQTSAVVNWSLNIEKSIFWKFLLLQTFCIRLALQQKNWSRKNRSGKRVNLFLSGPWESFDRFWPTTFLPGLTDSLQYSLLCSVLQIPTVLDRNTSHLVEFDLKPWIVSHPSHLSTRQNWPTTPKMGGLGQPFSFRVLKFCGATCQNANRCPPTKQWFWRRVL